MKTLFLSIVVSLFLNTSPASANSKEDSKITTIKGADLICSVQNTNEDGTQTSNAALAISTSNKKIWNIDSENDKEGLEHRVLNFITFRSPYRFDIESELVFFGSVVKNTIRTEGVTNEDGAFVIQLTDTIESPDSDNGPSTVQMTCEIVTKKPRNQ